MKKLLETLLTPFGPSGREDAISNAIAKAAKGLGEVYTDVLGNLTLHLPGQGRRVMVAAHMDSIGLVATYIDEDGFVRFGALGGLNLNALLNQRVRFETGVAGVVCAQGKADLKELKLTDLYVDTLGQPVLPGDTAVFVGDPIFAGDMVCSPYLDNRVGCAVALQAAKLLKDDHTSDLYFVFTVQEEVGLRGAKTAAWTVDPQLAVAVDVCGTADTPEPKEKSAVRLGGGPVVKYMDRSVLCHKDVIDALLEAGRQLDIPCQGYVAASGGTDAGMLHQTHSGVPTGVLSIPTRYIHTPGEVCSLADAQQCARLLAQVVRA